MFKVLRKKYFSQIKGETIETLQSNYESNDLSCHLVIIGVNTWSNNEKQLVLFFIVIYTTTCTYVGNSLH
jgi:hypothetical protein